MKGKRLALLILLCCILLPTTRAAQALERAQQPVEPVEPPVEPPIIPEPPIWFFDGLRIDYQRVNVTIQDQVATTHIEQKFSNSGDRALEGIYLFPLPPDATVTQLTMWVDEQAIDAKILDAVEARSIYDAIVRQQRDPALLEYVGAGAIQANVFPIPPGQERVIEIEYSQVLTAENGLFHFVYPQSTDLYTDTPLQNQNIRVEIHARQEIRAVYSPSHPIATTRDGATRAVASYEGVDVSPGGAFELFYAVAPEQIGLNLLSYRQPGEDGYFLLLIAPTIDVDPDEIVARDIILVLDTSGSMQGQKMDQAREAAHHILDQLNPDDRFNIVAFSSGVRTFAPQLTAASETASAHDFVDRLEATGGTNISLALLEALQQTDEERPVTILFLTDGLATEGVVDTPLLLQTVGDAAPPSARIFSFGIGHDVDTVLLGSLSQNHRGATTYVAPEQAIDEAVSAFYAKVSTPLLANVTLQIDGVTAEQIYPATLTDLFAGTQTIVAGRYREGGPARIILSGDVNGVSRTFTYDDISFRDNGGETFIPRLWATRAIGHLLQQIRVHGENEELVRSIVDLSIRYGIITPYTSFLIEEDDIFTQSDRDALAGEALSAPGAANEVSGADAVAQARTEGEFAAAEAAAPLPTAPSSADAASNNAPRALTTVGAKTFVYRDGVWIDTTYDPEKHSPQAVGFATDAYFQLLADVPEIAPYLSVGPHVLFVYQGLAFEVTGQESNAPLTLPTPDRDSELTPSQQQPATNAPGAANEPPAPSRAQPCLPLLLLPLFLFALPFAAPRQKGR